MNDEAVYRTAPATPGLLIMKVTDQQKTDKKSDLESRTLRDYHQQVNS